MIEKRLQILLEKLQLSQRQFALKLNLDPGYFCRIYNGTVTPPDRILLLIESVFGVNKSWLRDGKGEIFIKQNITERKKEIYDIIDTLDDQEINAVLTFLKYFSDNSPKD